jgi:hypothetical protein
MKTSSRPKLLTLFVSSAVERPLYFAFAVVGCPIHHVFAMGGMLKPLSSVCSSSLLPHLSSPNPLKPAPTAAIPLAYQFHSNRYTENREENRKAPE